MDVCYYAIREMVVGDEVRKPGDLIPEATTWREHIQRSYVEAHRIAPVAVVSLPKRLRDDLQRWERDYLKLTEVIEVEHPVTDFDEDEDEDHLDEVMDFDLDAVDEET